MNQTDTISVFCRLTSSSAVVAEHFLGASNWDLQRAVDLFLEDPPPGDAFVKPNEREASVGTAAGSDQAVGDGAGHTEELQPTASQPLTGGGNFGAFPGQRVDAEGARRKRREIIAKLRKKRDEESKEEEEEDAKEHDRSSDAKDDSRSSDSEVHRAFSDAMPSISPVSHLTHHCFLQICVLARQIKDGTPEQQFEATQKIGKLLSVGTFHAVDNGLLGCIFLVMVVLLSSRHLSCTQSTTHH